MMSAPSSIATATLDAFVGRLEQLECRLIRTPAGLDDASEGEGANAKRTTTIIEQLAKLQKSMHGLAVNSDGRKQLLLLQSRHKDLIKQSELPEVDTQEITAQLVALTRSAPLFKSTASRLVTIQDQTIPPTEHHCALISQAPRLGELAARQSDLELEVAGLRGRTTRLLEVLRASNLREAERWTGWEKRLRLIERQMARVMRERED